MSGRQSDSSEITTTTPVLPPAMRDTEDRWMVMVQQLMQRPDFNLEMLERILALRDKELNDRAKDEAVTAYAACQAEVNKAALDKNNPVYRAKYASLEAMYDAVTPVIKAHGFAWSVSWVPTPPGWGENILVYEGTLSRGRWEHKFHLPVDRASLMPQGPSGGRPAQIPVQTTGMITTYMRKYLLGLAFNVVTADDVALDRDGEGMRRPPPPKPPRTPVEPSKPTRTREEKPPPDVIVDERTERWLAKLEIALNNAATRDAVADIGGREDIAAALRDAPETVRERINALMQKAYDRAADTNNELLHTPLIDDELEEALDNPPLDESQESESDPVAELIAEIDTKQLHDLDRLDTNAEWRARVNAATRGFPPERERITEAMTNRRAVLKAAQR